VPVYVDCRDLQMKGFMEKVGISYPRMGAFPHRQALFTLLIDAQHLDENPLFRY
jgi:hypothetical protein